MKIKLYWPNRKKYAILSIDLKNVNVEIGLNETTISEEDGEINKTTKLKENEKPFRLRIKHSY